jgi:hypothetical protein
MCSCLSWLRLSTPWRCPVSCGLAVPGVGGLADVPGSAEARHRGPVDLRGG